MTKEAFDEAVAEAKRFLKIADSITWTKTQRANGPSYYWSLYETSTVKTGALRRASMDLTRSLARLRKW